MLRQLTDQSVQLKYIFRTLPSNIDQEYHLLYVFKMKNLAVFSLVLESVSVLL